MYTKAFRVDKDIKISQVISFLSTRLSLKDSSLYLLAPLKGAPLNSEDTLAAYGLGTLFDTWQLRMVVRGISRPNFLLIFKGNELTTNFLVEFFFPKTEPFTSAGLLKKHLRVDPYESVKDALARAFSSLRLPSTFHSFFLLSQDPHRYELVNLDGKVLADNDTMAKYGLGIKCRVYQVSVQHKRFPIGTNPVEGICLLLFYLS